MDHYCADSQFTKRITDDCGVLNWIKSTILRTENGGNVVFIFFTLITANFIWIFYLYGWWDTIFK